MLLEATGFCFCPAQNFILLAVQGLTAPTELRISIVGDHKEKHIHTTSTKARLADGWFSVSLEKI